MSVATNNNTAHIFEEIAKSLKINFRSAEQKIWLLRTESGTFYRDFKLNKYVALGWDKINTSIINDTNMTEEQKKDIIKSHYPEEKRPGLILGQLKTFYSQMKPGDYIVIPSKNSEALSIGILGELIANIKHIEIDEDYSHCKYTHKRQAEWLNDIIPVNDIYISRVLKSHQTITNISEYANVLYRNSFPIYIDENSVHLTLQKKSRTEMNLVDNIKLQTSIYNIISEISGLYSQEKIENTIKIKTAVGSPGFIEVFSNSLFAIPGLLFIFSKLLGRSKDKDKQDVSGISSIITQINNCFDAKVERDYRRTEIAEKEINNKKLEKELALTDIQIEKEKADLKKKTAEANLEQIKFINALKTLQPLNEEDLTQIDSKIQDNYQKLIEVINNNDIQLPS